MNQLPITNNQIIRRAELSDLSSLMSFIDKHWEEGHILSRDYDFFAYEYQCDNFLNFIISVGVNGNINGMLGFIPASSLDNSDVWGTMWKVSRDTNNPILGIQLLQYLKAQGHRTMMSLGINRKTIGLYRYLGYSTGTMNHHFLPNNTIKSFQIGKISTEIAGMQRPFKRSNRIHLRSISFDKIPTDFLLNSGNHTLPQKDLTYISKRYFRHPIYNYRVHGIYNNGKLCTLLVTRTVNIVTATALRLVDIIGNELLLPWVTHALNDIIESENMEYLDLVSYGLNERLLERACFSKLDLSSDEIIIPNYFQPFTQKNISINFFVDGKIPTNLRIFKADGDQDRPS